MYIGNVTELILTGNDITSTRGIDRLFSLEHLSLDENNIQSLVNVAGIAKLPFLMEFDLKGNPLESEGTLLYTGFAAIKRPGARKYPPGVPHIICILFVAAN